MTRKGLRSKKSMPAYPRYDFSQENFVRKEVWLYT
jgi:hypothetical protein